MAFKALVLDAIALQEEQKTIQKKKILDQTKLSTGIGERKVKKQTNE